MRVTPQKVAYRGARYVLASPVELSRAAASHLIGWLVDAELPKSEALSYLRSLNPSEFSEWYKRRRIYRSSEKLPDRLTFSIVSFFQSSGVPWDDFVERIGAEMDALPNGYFWKSKSGDSILMRQKEEPPPRPFLHGEKFGGKVLVGVWWTSKKAKAPASRALSRFIKKNNGGMFFRKKKDGIQQYGAAMVLAPDSVSETGSHLREMGARVKSAGGKFYLSALLLDGLSSGRKAIAGDQFNVHAIQNIRFNDEHTLLDLVNAELPEYAKFYTLVRGLL